MGSPAEDFEITAWRYAAKPFAQPTLANRLKAIWNFNRTPFHPGWNLNRFDHNRGFPTPSTPRLAIDEEGRKTSRLQAADQVSVMQVAARAHVSLRH